MYYLQNDVLGTAKLEGLQEGREEGRQEGRQEERIGIARNLKMLGLDIVAIQKATGLSAEEISKL